MAPFVRVPRHRRLHPREHIVKVTLQYIEGCPNWPETRAHLETLASQHRDVEIDLQRIDTPEAAERVGFRGSPTILVDGDDPFADGESPVGLACRVYRTEAGYAGSPTLEQLRHAIAASSRGG